MTAPNRRPLFALLLALSTMLLLLATQVSIRPQSKGALSRKQDRPESPAERMTFTGQAPKGRWSVSAVPDIGQATDTTTPVVVGGLSSLFGRKE